MTTADRQAIKRLAHGMIGVLDASEFEQRMMFARIQQDPGAFRNFLAGVSEMAEDVGSKCAGGVVHQLAAGEAICGAGVPSDWPDADRWSQDHNDVTCLACRDRVK